MSNEPYLNYLVIFLFFLTLIFLLKCMTFRNYVSRGFAFSQTSQTRHQFWFDVGGSAQTLKKNILLVLLFLLLISIMTASGVSFSFAYDQSYVRIFDRGFRPLILWSACLSLISLFLIWRLQLQDFHLSTRKHLGK